MRARTTAAGRLLLRQRPLGARTPCAAASARAISGTPSVAAAAVAPEAAPEAAPPASAAPPGAGARDALAAALMAQRDEAFFVLDRSELARRCDEWERALPRVRPYYAVKCNPDEHVLGLLRTRGVGFDCASAHELAQVTALGADAVRDTIFAHPCKSPAQLRDAIATATATAGGGDDAPPPLLMTFDSAEELPKVAEHARGARLVLRIAVDETGARCRLGNKFGAQPGEAVRLLQCAVALGLNVVGLAYHVGSGNGTVGAYTGAVETARRVFDDAAAAGHELELLDVGGGFPGAREEQSGAAAMAAAAGGDLAFGDIAAQLGPALDAHFPPSSGVALMAEPGRYLVDSACTLYTGVIAHKRNADTGERMYFVNDSIYSSFNSLVYDHATVHPEVAAAAGAGAGAGAPLERASVWGQSCDGLDCIVRSALLPRLQVGDWLRFRNMGAYTSAAASRFNGFALPDRFCVD